MFDDHKIPECRDINQKIYTDISNDHFTQNEQRQMEPYVKIHKQLNEDLAVDRQKKVPRVMFMMGAGTGCYMSAFYFYGKYKKDKIRELSSRKFSAGFALLCFMTVTGTFFSIRSFSIHNKDVNRKLDAEKSKSTNPELLREFDAIKEKEYFNRYITEKNNEKYKVLRSRLSKGQSPIQQAVQDSYINMEQLQKNKAKESTLTFSFVFSFRKELQDQQQPKNLTSDEYSNDDFAKQIAEAEAENNKWKKQK